jgi:hypothetical protein
MRRIIFFACMLLTKPVFSAITLSVSQVTQQINLCGTGEFKISVQLNSGSIAVGSTIALDLDINNNYAKFVSTTVNLGNFSVNSNNVNAPIFTVINSPIIADFNFNYIVSIGCDISNGASSLISQQVTTTFSTPLVTNHLYNVNVPNFTIPTYATQYVHRNDITPIVRPFIFTNSGGDFSSAIQDFQFSYNLIQQGNAATNMNIVDYTVYDQQGHTVTVNAGNAASINFLVGSLGPVFIVPHNEALTISVRLLVVDCPGTEGEYDYGWGCGHGVNYAECKNINPTRDAFLRDMSILTGMTTQRVSPTNGQTCDDYWDNSCSNNSINNSKHWEFNIYNEGNQAFYNCFFNLRQYYANGSSVTNDYTYITQGSILITYYPSAGGNQNQTGGAGFIPLSDTYDPLPHAPANYPACLQYFIGQGEVPVSHCVYPIPNGINYNATHNYISFGSTNGFTFYPGDRYNIQFNTYRCCPELDVNSDGWDMFDEPYYFNHWQMYIQGENECSNPNDIASFSDSKDWSVNHCQSTTHPLNNDASLINSNNQSNGPDLQLSQTFDPDVIEIDPSVIQNPEFVVLNQSFLTDVLNDNQLYQNTSGGVPSLELKVSFDFDPGLSLVMNHTDLYLVNPGFSNTHWDYDHIVINNNTAYDQCGKNLYEVFFKLSAFAPVTDNFTFKNFMGRAETHFRMNAACPPPICIPAYTLHPTYRIYTYLNPKPQVACAACFMPLASDSSQISIHCPGCITPGFDTKSFTLEREQDSWGFKDYDDNGKADAIVQIGSNIPGVKYNHSMPGDHLLAKVSAVYSEGIPGFTYNDWSSAWNPGDELNYLYLDLQITGGATANYDIELNEPVLTAGNLFVTQGGNTLQYTIPSSYCDVHTGIGSDIFYKIPMAQITAAIGYSLPLIESVSLEVKLKVCNNPIVMAGSLASFNPINNVSPPLPSKAAVYISDGNNGHYAGEVFDSQNIEWATDQLSNCLNDAQCSPDIYFLQPFWVYCCGAWSTPHRFYTIPTRNIGMWGDQLSNNYCHKYLSVYQIIEVGGEDVTGDGVNVFPKEYRPVVPLGYNPIIHFRDPINGYLMEGYKFGSIIHTYDPGCSPYQERSIMQSQVIAGAISSPYTQPNGAIYATDALGISTLPACISGVGTTQDPSLFGGNSIVIGDERVEIALGAYYKPDCANPVSTVSFSAQDESIQNMPTYGCNPSTISVDDGLTPLSDFTMPFVPPVLSMTSPSTVLFSNGHVTWTFQIENISSQFGVQYGWLYIDDPNGYLSNFSINHGTIVQTTPVWVKLGAINALDRITYVLTADVDCSLDESILYQIPVYYGWTCDGYPVNNDLGINTHTHTSNNVCTIIPDYSEVLQFELPSNKLQAFYGNIVPNPPDQYNLCQSYDFEACVQNLEADGGVNHFVVTIGLPVGLEITQSSSIYFKDNISYSSTVNYTLSNNPGCGLNDGSSCTVDLNTFDPQYGVDNWLTSTDASSACIVFSITPTCEYITGMPQVCFDGMTTCGDWYTNNVNHPSPAILNYAQWDNIGSVCNPPCPPLPIIYASQNVICSGEATTLSLTILHSSGPFSYTWSTNESTGSITVNPTITTTYSVNVYDNITGLTGTAVITIIVLPSSNVVGCCVPPNFNAPPGYNLSYTSVSSLIANDLRIVTQGTDHILNAGHNTVLINGTFTVDANLTLGSCTDIQMGPGAQIVIQPYVTLNIDDSHIYACSDMWRSIEVYPNAVLNVTGSMIEDGGSAINGFGDGSGNAEVHVDQSRFNKNYISITLSDGNFSSSTFTHNTFECTTHLLSGGNAYAHFWLNDVDAITIGEEYTTQYLDPRNQIQGADYGVFAKQTHLISYNNYFDNIGNSATATTNAGIFITSGDAPSTLLAGDVTAGGFINHFTNCAKGIYSGSNTRTEIYSNTFTTCGMGVHVYGNTNQRINVSFNALDKCGEGIYTEGLTRVPSLTINNNVITSDHDLTGAPTGNHGIAVYNYLQYPYDLQINNNIVDDYHYGIRIVNGLVGNSLFDIKQNHIHYYFGPTQTGGWRYRGIYLSNCRGAKVDQNTADWYSGLGTPYDINQYANVVQGLRMEYVHKSAITGNTVSTCGTGMYMYDICTGTYYSCNNFQDDYPGIEYNLTSLPDQGGPCQPAYNTWNGTFSVLYPKNRGNGNFFNYWYSGSTSITNPENPLPGLSPINPFNVNGCIPYNNCNNGHGGNSPDDPGKKDEELGRIVDDPPAPTGDDFEGEAQYKKQEYAYKIMQEDPNLINTIARVDFMDVTEQNNIGKQTEVNDLIISEDENQAISANNLVLDSNLIEHNKKEVNSIIINSSIDNNDTLTNSDSTSLAQIAELLAVEGGEAVYWSRGRLKLDIEDEMTALRKRRTNLFINPPVSKLVVYPNPASDELFLQSMDQGIKALSIENFLGEQVLFNKPESEVNYIKLAIGNLKEGTYLIKVFGSSQTTYAKFTIVR